jgi:hypothetical protein
LGHRGKKLFVIEIASLDDGDDEGVDEEIECAALTGRAPGLEISLHAITGVRARGVQTMKVYVFIRDAIAVALLDLGSCHNFLDVQMAHRAGLRLHSRSGLSVAVANCEWIASPGRVDNQAVFIGGKAFTIDLYALPLGEYDMVLGVQWLATLGPILWDLPSTPWRSGEAPHASSGVALIQRRASPRQL